MGDDIKIQEDDRAKFLLYEEKCVVCVHLFPRCSKRKTYNKCHYKNGNPDCPAQEVVFIVKPKVNKRAEAIFKKIEDGDVQKAIILLQRLVKEPEEEQKNILHAVREKIKSRD